MQHDQKQRKLAILHHRRERAERRITELRRVESRFPWVRLGVLLVCLAAAGVAFQTLPFGLAVPAAMAAFAPFAGAALLHNRVIEQINRLLAFDELLRQQVARMRLDWETIPPASNIAVAFDHPFASDCSITGSRSLHQLMDTCVSFGGSQMLADWLLAAAPDIQAVSQRQAVVQEYLDHTPFLTRLELNGLTARPEKANRWDTGLILRWLEGHTTNRSLQPLLWVLFGLAGANVTLFMLHAAGVLPPFWIATIALYLFLQSLRYREASETFEEAYALARQLGQLRAVLVDLETYPYPANSLLGAVCAPIWKSTQRPTEALRKVGLVASAASLRNNPVLSLFLNLLVPWDLFFAFQLEQMKKSLRGVLPAWLHAWYELEALGSLANFAAMNPENTFPKIQPTGALPVLECVEIGHPLISEPARVNNNFTIESLGEVLIITGSNMSGKSTFLRTIAVNLVLAYAGSTVAARRLRVIPARLFTSMTLNDSLSDGISFFYAEVRRLKALLTELEADGPLPLFFFIDEIFRGTNNRERQIGSKAFTQALAGRNGAGLISTHDLELAHLADAIPSVQNYHFREDIRDGQMVFDYTIRSGPSPTTNALRIMALAGLPVPKDIKNP